MVESNPRQHERDADPQQSPRDAGSPASASATEQLAHSATYQLAPGTQMQYGRYIIERMLGKGGMGFVYLAQDTHFTGPAARRALKELIPRFSDLQANLGTFTREANTLAGLRHQGIPRVYDSFTEFRRAYLVLDYIHGEDLDHVLAGTTEMLPQDEVGRWVCQLCSIVQYLHTRTPPIVFRDLKPSNVVLTPERQIVLIDFGIARVFEPDNLQTTIGTHGYAAPEQYEGRAEPRSDIYSLGAMMHHMLTRTDPRRHVPSSFADRPIRDYNPAVSPELAAVVERCLEHDMDKRYQRADDLRGAIEAALGFAYPDTESAYSVSSAAHTPWAAHAEYAAGVGQATSRLRWRTLTQGEIRGTPAVSGDLVLIGSYDGHLYALDQRTGDLRWQFATAQPICSTPLPWQDLVIIGSEDFHVYGLDAATGREVWRHRTWGHVRSSPRTFEDRVYIGSDDGHIHVLDPRTGDALWTFEAYREVRSSAAAENGILFVGSSDEYLYAVDMRSRERKWAYHTEGPIISSPAVADGYVYVGSLDFSVYCVEAKSGWLAWCERTDRFVVSSPCLVADRLYIGSTDKHLYCLNRRTGQRIWRYAAGDQVNSTPVHAGGAIYFGCVDGGVYSVDAASGKLLWRFATGGKVPGSACVHAGVVYIGSTDGCLYALEA